MEWNDLQEMPANPLSKGILGFGGGGSIPYLYSISQVEYECVCLCHWTKWALIYGEFNCIVPFVYLMSYNKVVRESN